MSSTSGNGSKDPADPSKPTTASRFDKLGFYRTETLLKTYESLSKNQMDSTYQYESYYNYMKRRYKEYLKELDAKETNTTNQTSEQNRNAKTTGIRDFDEEERSRSIEREGINR